MLILSSVCRGLKFWSVNHSLIYWNSELKVLKNIEVFNEIPNNWPNDLLGRNVCETLESCW